MKRFSDFRLLIDAFRILLIASTPSLCQQASLWANEEQHMWGTTRVDRQTNMEQRCLIRYQRVKNEF